MAVKEPLQIAIISTAFKLPGILDAVSVVDTLFQQKINYSSLSDDFWSKRCGYTCSTPSFAGIISDIDHFPAEYFGIIPREVPTIDPQQRLVLLGIRDLLESASFHHKYGDISDVGVFIGASGSEYRQRFINEPVNQSLYATTGTANSVIAGRVSYHFNFSGPSLVVDTACSSSLVSVALAVNALKSKSCRFAIAGGVNLLISARTNDEYSLMGMTSKSGRNATFSDSADGYVRSEGYGFVLLRPLSDALRDGDTILGVISSAVINQDGTTNGITAPSGAAQISLIKSSLNLANLSPSDISYHECHGTATRLGDSIELRSLASIFDSECRLPIGSFKANIGHLEVAAGIAGLIKSIILLRTGKIPPHPFADIPNKTFNWDSGHGLLLPASVESLSIDSQGHSHIGISSFGFSGTNCHIILSDYKTSPVDFDNTAINGNPGISLVSSPNKNLLDCHVARVYDYLKTLSTNSHAISHSTLASRERFDSQSFIDLVGPSNLSDYSTLNANINNLKPLQDGLVFIFDGQGCYHDELGKTLYTQSVRTRCALDHCIQILKELQYPYADLISQHFISSGLESNLHLPPAAQQIVIAISQYAIAFELLTTGIKPSLVIGHSLGEYTAAVISGKITLEFCLAVLTHRSLLIQEVGQLGTLIAVNISPEQVTCSPFNLISRLSVVNSDSSVVLGCLSENYQSLVSELSKSARFTDLNLTVPYHTEFISTISDQLKACSYPESISNPNCRLISCVTADFFDKSMDIEYWALQLQSTVLFSDALRLALLQSPKCLIEISPRPILSRHINKLLSSSPVPLLTTEEQPDKNNSTFATRILSQLLSQGLLDPNYFLTSSSTFPIDPLLPVTGLGGESYWYQHTNTGNPVAAQSHAISTISPESVISTSSGPINTSDDQLITKELVHLFGQICSINTDKIDVAKPFQRFGADSLLLSQFATQLSTKTGITITVAQLFGEYNTIEKLIDCIRSTTYLSSPEQLERSELSYEKPASQDYVINQPVTTTTTLPSSSIAFKQGVTPPSSPENPAYNNYILSLSRSLSQKLPNSKQIRSISSFHLADSRAIAGYDPDFKEFQFPVVGESGFGASILDVDGNKYVDLTMGFGVQLFGHHPDFIDNAIRNQLTKGVHLGPQSKLASKVACLISEVTGKERIAFCNSGTEAIMTALRIARARSRKTLVAQFIGAYHGHFDPTLCIKDVSGGSLPLSPGIPLDYTSNTLLLDYSNADETIATLSQFKEQLAAVLVEPIQSRNPSLQPLSLLKQIETFCKSNDILLIFDEVLTGFRVSQSGVQGLFDLKPHLTCYGKIIGGGLPIGVVAGDSDVMDYLDKGSWIPGQSAPNDTIANIFFAGTFNKNPLVMATAEAVLLHLRSANGAIQRSLNTITDQFIARLNTALSSISRDVRVDHFSSFFRFVGFPPIFYYALLDKGLYVWEGRTCFLSTSHTQADLQLIHDVVLATTQELVDIGALTSSDANKSLTPSNISPSPQPSSYRLTSSQVEMLASHLIDPNAASKYNQSLLVRIPSSVDITRLLLAISNTFKLHTELYTSYDLDTKLATIHSPFNLKLSISTSIEEAVKSSFSPQDGVNARIFLISDASNDSSTLRLLLVFPHFSVDGWSLQLIANGISKSYDLLGTETTISNLTVFDNSYCDYSKYVFSVIADSSSHAYWSAQLANCTTTISFLGDSGNIHDDGKHNSSYSSSYEVREINLDRLCVAASSLGVSPYVFLLSIFIKLISELTAHEDFVVATICAGQLTSGMHSLVGNCTSILPLRFFRHALVADLFNSVDKIFAESLSHSHYDLRRLLDSLSIKPNKCGHALSNVCFNYDSLQPSDSPLASNIAYNPQFLHESKWDLFLNIESSPKSILLSLEANLGHVSRSLAESILPAYVELLTRYISNPSDLHSSRFSLINTPGNYSAGQLSALSHNLVSEQVTKRFENNWLLSRLNSYGCLNDRIALRSNNRALTYLDLLNEIKSLADKVLSYCGDNNLIAIATTDSLDSVSLMLTCWASGNAPLHLSTNDPISWTFSRIRQAKCHLVISNDLSLATAGSSHISLSPHLFLIKLPHHYNRSEYIEPTYLSDAAYLLCTSGTTGEPKIPVIPHEAIENYTYNISACLGLSEHEQDHYIFGLLTPLSSDLGYTMVFPALYYGHTLRCFSYSEARDGILLSTSLQNDPIDFLKVVPSHLSALIDSGLSFDNLPKHSIVFGGDFLSPRLVSEILQRNKDIKVYNHYGPSETTVGVCCIRLTPEDLDRAHSYIPVGKPFPGTSIRISPLPDDYSSSDLFPDIKLPKGEVVISGSSLMLGYSDQLLNPGLSTAGLPADYCSGDIGFIDETGCLVILGRMSQLIKIKGYRVSIPFLESQIAELSLFSESVIIPFSSAQSSDIELVCLACSVDPDTVTMVRAELFSRVPSYYRPKHFFIVEAIPKLSNGKPDRRSCAEIVNNLISTGALTRHSPQAIPAQSSQYANTAEWSQLQLLLSQVLRLEADNISLSSSFIELGGDSIDAIRFASLLRKSGFTLSPVQILESDSLDTLFSLLSHNSNHCELSIASTQLQSNGELVLTPAQALAFSLNPANLENWGLCCLVRIPDTVSDDDIANRIKSIVVGSASLQYSLIDGRLRLTRKASSHSYRSSVVHHLDFDSYQTESDFLVPTSVATDLAGQLSISDSRYIAWTKISGPKQDQNTYIVLCVHHFFFDVISLQSLVSCLYPLDGELGLVGNADDVEKAMASIYGSVSVSSHELDLYLNSLRQPPPLPFNVPSTLPASSFSSVSFSLSKYNLDDCFRSPRFGSLPAFLYCLCKALSKFTGLHELLIDIETHGRPVDQSSVNTLDIFSFFTCHTPIALETAKNNRSILDILRVYERELTCISKIAIPYNILALGESSLGHQQVIFSVNYVSMAPSILSKGPDILSYDTGVLSSESFLRSYPFQFIVLENASDLIIRFDFDPGLLDTIGVSLPLLNEHIQELWNTDLCEAQSTAQARHHISDSCLTDHDDNEEDILGRLFS